LRRFRNLLAVCALALPIPAAIAGCGGDSGSDVDPQTVLDDTFNNDQKVSSGDLSLSLNGSADGAAGGSFEASLEGPFQGDPDNPNAIPQLDFTGKVDYSAAGQSASFEGGLTVTDDNAFVDYGGNTYEVGTDTFSQFKQMAEQAAQQQQSQTSGLSFGEAFKKGCEAQLQAAGGDTSACDIDFESWLTDLSSEGTENIEGTDADHVSGSLDVNAMLQDLIKLGSAVPQASGVPSEDQVQQIADAIDEASFDLYSGTDDHVLRGLDFNLSIDPSAIPQAASTGVSSIDLGLTMRLGAVNEDQTIEAPSGAKPLDQLLNQLGVSPSALGGLGGLGGVGGASLPGTGGSGGGGGGAGNTQAYFDCIQNATTSAEIDQCASQL